jgi:hypothetical protein
MLARRLATLLPPLTFQIAATCLEGRSSRPEDESGSWAGSGSVFWLPPEDERGC